MNNLITVNPNDYGINENEAKGLIGSLPQIKHERTFLEDQYNEVIKMDIEKPETSIIARDLRLKIRDNRTKGLQVWHKTTKDYFLKGGQFIDAVKNKEIAINERMEETLETIEKHFELKEKQRIEELKTTRLKMLEPYYSFSPFGIDYGSLSEEEFTKIYNGAKLQYEAEIERIKAEELENEKRKQAEAERIRIENEERKKQQLENERLKKQLEEERLEKQRLEEQQKKEIELREKQLEEERLEKQRLANAPIQEQLTQWVNSFSIPETNVKNVASEEIIQKFAQFKNWALNQIKNI